MSRPAPNDLVPAILAAVAAALAGLTFAEITTALGERTARRTLQYRLQRLVEAGEQFVEVAETELLALHEGNFARDQIRPSQYEAWRKIWDA